MGDLIRFPYSGMPEIEERCADAETTLFSGRVASMRALRLRHSGQTPDRNELADEPTFEERAAEMRRLRLSLSGESAAPRPEIEAKSRQRRRKT